MGNSIRQSPRLVADVGGTNTRLALFDPLANEFLAHSVYLNAEFDRFEDIVEQWLVNLSEPSPATACMAIAAPPFRDQVTMLNIDWSFSCTELAKRFGFKQMGCINDFEGVAYALPHLTADNLEVLQTGQQRDVPAKMAALGPGTGLGGSTLDTRAGATIACACEPGHVGLAAATTRETALFSALQPEYGEIYAEFFLSGPGLLRLYRAMADVMGLDAANLTPKEISDRAIARECDLCVAALDTFCALLGSTSGDFVLANGAYGGLYLTGGILPKIIPFLQASNFRQRFCGKGKMGDHLARVPIYVILGDTPGLLGAAHAPLNRPFDQHL